MKNKLILCIGFLTQLLGISSYAQQKQAVKPLKPADVKSLLWKISGKGLKKPSYIFGTIHAICSEDYFFTDKMKQAFQECNQLVLEVNLSDANMTDEVQAGMALENGLTLRDYFPSEEEYQSFSEKLREKAGIEVETFSKFKPFVLISALTMKGFSCTNTASYEMNLLGMSNERKIKVAGLETTNSQFEIFDNMPREELKQMLLDALNEDGNAGEENTEEKMIALYKKQDIEGLALLINQSKEIKGHEDELLVGRNKTWVKKLPEMMTANQSFIAVGAGHLPGNTGVLQLLRKDGYKVEAVK